MAPGLNGRQTGTVPKNKPRNNGAPSQRNIREALIQSSSLEWEPVLDQNSRSRPHRKTSSTYSETEADSIRYDLAGPGSSTMSSQMRFEDQVNEGNSQDLYGNRLRTNIPDKKQVINKITQIQDYIQQTASLMSALKGSDCPEKQKQYEKLSLVLDDLKDSEGKLNEMLKKLEATELREESSTPVSTPEMNQGDNNNNSSDNEEELIRRTEESKRKLEVLQKRKQELIELQEKVKKQLQDAQMEQSRLVARASTLTQDIGSNKFLDLNMQQLSQRLKTTQHLFKTSNQITEALSDGRELNLEEPEHPDEDQTETSDVETDFQMVADRVAELNMMKSQLAQIQKLMANISLESNAKDGITTPEMTEDRRDQQLRSVRNESHDEISNNAVKMEQAKLKLNQLTHLLELAQSTQGGRVLPPGLTQAASNLMNEDTGSVRRSPSPTYSAKVQSKSSEEMYVETMQLMTRELEEKTAAMREEHDKLVAARQELENLARKIPMVKADRVCLSPDDSNSEAPCLTNITMDSNGRILNAAAQNEQQALYNERSPFSCRAGNSKTRQKGEWNAYGIQEMKCKNEELSRGIQMNGLQNGISRETSGWSPSPTVSFCDNGSCSIVQTQNHLEKSGTLCGRLMNEMFQRTGKPDEITVEELYNQHQMLTRTVAQCSHLIWLQQKQIIELRNTLMLQQSTLFQSASQQQVFQSQPPRNTSVPPALFQMNSLPIMPFQPQMPMQQEQNYLSPNPNPKLNPGAIPNISQDFSDQFYQQGLHASLPFSVPDALDFQMRYGNYNRSSVSNSNINQNLNQNGPSGLNNRIPLGGMSCLGPEDSGALNNQVPPGNRANNYWDNFRSYSRQNLLSHSKSNEGTDTARRATTSNQERPLREASSSVMVQNNTPVGPSNEPCTPSSPNGAIDTSDYDAFQSPPSQANSTSRPNHVQVSRSRSVESQSHRKNESRNQENDSRNLNPKNDPRIRNPEGGPENIRNVRSGVNCQSGSSRNFVQLVREDEGRSCNNKKRIVKTRGRNEGRGNLNNRANTGLPVVLGDNVYSEVTNFIRANENRPDFLIQLFRDLQQVTTDPLRQRMLESIQETVNVNNLTERSNINGANLNIIDNRNNIRESRSNLNRNQGDEQNIDNLVCQIRENQNRQNLGGNSSLASSGNLENPNISNIRNIGNPRNNLENEGLRDLRTYYEASLCNFGHNSALENPNLSNIRENLTRRGTTGTDLDNPNPKNLYLSMYDNVWRRNQEFNSGPESIIPFQNGREESAQNPSHCNNVQCCCNNQVPPVPGSFRIDGNCSENRQVLLPQCPVPDNKYVNVTRDIGTSEEDSEAYSNYNNDWRKISVVEGNEIAQGGKKNDPDEDGGDKAGAAALIPSDWDRNGTENRAYLPSATTSRSEMSCIPVLFDETKYTCSDLPQLANGDLAEADQSRNEETLEGATESYNGFTNLQVPEPEDENCSVPSEEPEDHLSRNSDRRSEVPVAGESCFSDVREAESEESYGYEHSTSESEGTLMQQSDNNDLQLRRNMSL